MLEEDLSDVRAALTYKDVQDPIIKPVDSGKSPKRKEKSGPIARSKKSRSTAESTDSKQNQQSVLMESKLELIELMKDHFIERSKLQMSILKLQLQKLFGKFLICSY